ncbi:beta/gamma crystallin-related protein [Scytonema sp. PCC 10023]|uniref:beta/gamma crystallin-related protein n=1 Tax=Scytonema sp. PCC 10023 TaxID=1680591 RepID=UPI0039C5FD50
MKDNQHEQLFTELDPVFEEISDDNSASLTGGVVRFASGNPDIILYDSPNRGLGDALQINAGAYEGDANLDNNPWPGQSGWNNKTSSIQVIRGNWVIYEHTNRGGRSGVTLTPNGGPNRDGVYPNARAFGLPDNSLTGIFRTNV